MDNLTHTLTGLALARAGLNRFSPRSTLLLILSANAPDLDIAGLSGGTLRYFELHRGYTHSLLCLPLLAALSVAVVAAIFRKRLPWAKAFIICCVGVASHLLLDWTNSYGVRLLLPASSRWFHLDLNSLYEVWILAALTFAVLWPAFSALVSGEIGSRGSTGRGWAISALAFFVLFDCGKALLHHRAVEQLEAVLWDDAPALRAAALPGSMNPLVWAGIVETARGYQRVPVNSLQDLDMSKALRFYKPPVTPALQNAAATPPFHYFQYFARFPVWSTAPVLTRGGEGTRVDLTDLRFGEPGAGSFHCVARTNSGGTVLEEWFTFGSGRDLGWGEAGARAVE